MAVSSGGVVHAVALTGATPNAEKKEIQRQLIALAERQSGPDEEIKLCYVTVRSALLDV